LFAVRTVRCVCSQFGGPCPRDGLKRILPDFCPNGFYEIESLYLSNCSIPGYDLFWNNLWWITRKNSLWRNLGTAVFKPKFYEPQINGSELQIYPLRLPKIDQFR